MIDAIRLGKGVAAAAVLGFFAGSARADLVAWQTQAAGTSGNVTASTHGGSGWTLNGSAGVTYDYGNLDGLGGKPVDGSTVEYIFNFSDNGTSVAIGAMYSWSPGAEKIVYKLEQWSNTGQYGLTWPGYADYTLTTPSTFNQNVDVVFRRNSSGTIDMFINGVYAETDTNKTNWRMDGGVGIIGATFAGDADFALGTMYGVASYDVALTDTDIYNLHSAYTAVPEPSTVGLLGLVGVSALLRRRMKIKK